MLPSLPNHASPWRSGPCGGEDQDKAGRRTGRFNRPSLGKLTQSQPSVGLASGADRVHRPLLTAS